MSEGWASLDGKGQVNGWPLLARRLCLFFLLVTILPVSVAVADPPAYDEDTVRLLIDEVTAQLKTKQIASPELDAVSERLAAILSTVEGCVEGNKAELDKVDKTVEALGPKGEAEASEVSQQRKALRKAKLARQQELTQCQVFSLQVGELLNTSNLRRQQLAQATMRHQSDDLIALLARQPGNVRALWGEISPFFAEQTGLSGLSRFALGLGGTLIVLALGLGLWLGRRLRGWLVDHPHPLVRDLGPNLARSLAVLLPTLTLATFVQLVTSERQELTSVVVLAATVCLYLVLRLLIGLVIKAVEEDVPSLLALRLERYGKGLALLLCVTLLLVRGGSLSAAESPSWLLLWVVMTTGVCLLGLRLSWLVSRVERWGKWGKWLRLLLAPVLVVAMLTAWLGYHNLSHYLLLNTAKTMIGLGVYLLARALLAFFFRGLADGGRGWAVKLRKKTGLEGQDIGTSLFWLHALLDLFCLALFLLLVIANWSISPVFVGQVVALLTEGFAIGHIPIVPLRVFVGILLFFLCWTLSVGAKALIRQALASKGQLSASTRDATVTVAGYLGFTLALLVGTGVAGLSFTSLTVIAGALSVGIGFGLQNIVNNFVSGLILIFERPIQRGDWIAVGSTEGYVTDISVRSTVIRTFDRAEVIVPNSELISGQVTNWMLSDRKGRVKIPIGVAYGTDTELVKRLLIEVACAHPEVITSTGDLAPQVLFMEFGESSLNFELRCFIHEIGKRPFCRSELNFAIEKAFRGHGIEIPFPQRDLHLKGDLFPKRLGGGEE